MSDKVRLFICAQCQTIQEIPWFEGPQEYDDTGNYRLAEHSFADGRQHPYTVGDVVKSAWDDSQYRAELVRQIVEQITRANPEVGLGQAFYDVKATFQEDAMACWKRHGRRVNCEDYMSDRMRLLPDTAAERKAEGLNPKTRPSTKLCQFCPVNAHVVQLQRKERGDYDKQPGELA